MYDKIPTAGMGREEWLALRRTGIGGSDAGAVCGLNPYSSPMDVFRDKAMGMAEEKDSEAIRIGHDLEGYVAARFMEATGRKVRKSNFMYRSREHPFMVADVDRLVIGEDAGLECKTASAYSAGKWKDGSIPPHYALQCFHYMAVTGKRAWYLAAAILGHGFVFHKLLWDDDLINGLIAAEKAFWEDHVVAGVMPAPDGSKTCDLALGRHFHTAREASAVALVGFDDKLARREEILASIEELEAEQRLIEQEVKLFMQDNEQASSERYRVSWGNVSTTRLDTKRMRKERPELYQAYAKTSVSRKFQVRAA